MPSMPIASSLASSAGPSGGREGSGTYWFTNTAVDLEEVVRTCREAPETFRSFAAEVRAWLERPGGEHGAKG